MRVGFVLLFLLANAKAFWDTPMWQPFTRCEWTPRLMSNGVQSHVMVNGDEYLLLAHRPYLGCHVDDWERAMPDHHVEFYHTNTPSSCIAECESQGYKYAGVQWGYECFCSDSYDKYGPAPESDCNKPCDGDSNLQCGGGLRNSVWATKHSNDLIQIQASRVESHQFQYAVGWRGNTFVMNPNRFPDVFRDGELDAVFRFEGHLQLDGVQIACSGRGYQEYLRCEVRLRRIHEHYAFDDHVDLNNHFVLAKFHFTGVPSHWTDRPREIQALIYGPIDGWGACFPPLIEMTPGQVIEMTPGQGGNPPSLFSKSQTPSVFVTYRYDNGTSLLYRYEAFGIKDAHKHAANLWKRWWHHGRRECLTDPTDEKVQEIEDTINSGSSTDIFTIFSSNILPDCPPFFLEVEQVP